MNVCQPIVQAYIDAAECDLRNMLTRRAENDPVVLKCREFIRRLRELLARSALSAFQEPART